MVKTGIKYSIFFILIIIGISVYGFFTIAEGTQIPSHFDLSGNIDDTQPRNFMLIMMPLLAITITLLFAAIPIIDPRRRHVEQSSGLFYSGWLGALTILAVLHAMIIISAAHNTIPDSRWIMVGISALLIVMGNFMAKSRSTWFLGLRTPWTLSSEEAWVKANRLTGWLLVVTGIITIITAIFYDQTIVTITLLIGISIAALAGIVTSFFVWRADEERTGGGE